MPSSRRATVRDAANLLSCLVLVAAVLAAAGAAAAQEVQPLVRLTPDVTQVSLGPNESSTIVWTVTNLGQTQGTVSLALDPQPPGWTTTWSQDDRSFTLVANESRQVEVGVEPRTGDAMDPSNGTLRLRATVTNLANQPGEGAESAVMLSYVAPPPPALPPPPPPPPSLVPWILGGVALLLMVLAGLYVWQSARVRLTVDEAELPVTNGSHAHFAVRVQNRSWVSQEVSLRVRGLARPWFAAFMVPAIRLRPGESAQVPLSLKVPLDAPRDTRVGFRIEARPNTLSLWLVGRDLKAKVSAAGPEAAPSTPASAPS